MHYKYILYNIRDDNDIIYNKDIMYYLEDLQSLTYQELLDYHYELAVKRADLIDEAAEWGKQYEALKMLMSEHLQPEEFAALFGSNVMVVKH